MYLPITYFIIKYELLLLIFVYKCNVLMCQTIVERIFAIAAT